MQIKTTSGSGAAGLGIVGTGLALALPEVKWIGWLLVIAGLMVFLFDVRIERGHVAVGSPMSLRQRWKRMWPQYLMVVAGILFFVGLVAFLQQNVNPPETPGKTATAGPAQAPLTLQSLFTNDFPDTSRYEIGVQLTLANGHTLEIQAKRFIHFASRSKFMGFYVPPSPDTYAICEYLTDGYKESLQHMDSTFKVNGQVLGESGRTSSDDLIFSNRIFIYHEDYLSPEQVGSLIGAYRAKGLDVKFRSQEYVVNRNLSAPHF
jgi:hypothetical protein